MLVGGMDFAANHKTVETLESTNFHFVEIAILWFWKMKTKTSLSKLSIAKTVFKFEILNCILKFLIKCNVNVNCICVECWNFWWYLKILCCLFNLIIS